MSPTIFGFLPGVGPIERIRHSLSPQISWSYALPTEVNQAYLDALDPTGIRTDRPDRALHTLRLGISQTIEGKYVQEGADTLDTRNAPKLKLLQWQTSGVEYDFEQASEEGRNWVADSRPHEFVYQ